MVCLYSRACGGPSSSSFFARFAAGGMAVPSASTPSASWYFLRRSSISAQPIHTVARSSTVLYGTCVALRRMTRAFFRSSCFS